MLVQLLLQRGNFLCGLKSRKYFLLVPPSHVDPDCFLLVSLPYLTPTLRRLMAAQSPSLLSFCFCSLSVKWKLGHAQLSGGRQQGGEHNKYLKILLTRIYSCDHTWLQERLGNMTCSCQNMCSPTTQLLWKTGRMDFGGQPTFSAMARGSVEKHFSTAENT